MDEHELTQRLLRLMVAGQVRAFRFSDEDELKFVHSVHAPRAALKPGAKDVTEELIRQWVT